MQMDLSEESDRTVAFSGIVSSFSLSQKLTGTYLAGFWRAHLPLGLSWYVFSSKASRSSRFLAPSWTWTSIRGPCQLALPGYRCMSDSGVKLLVTLESASVIATDGCSNPGSLMGGAVTIRGDIIGPVSLEFYEQSAHLVDKHKGEKQANIHFDENDDDGPLITNMGGFPAGKSQRDLRQVERLTNHTGSFFVLPIADVSSMHVVYGLVLYQTLHKPSVFSRVGFVRSKGYSKEERFNFQVANISDAGALVTIV